MTEQDVAAPRDAATIMLLRDKATGNGIEVFMLQRHHGADFGGAFVFPGGLAADTDYSTELEPYCCGLTDSAASAQLSVKSGGLALWVAAIRECFEESGYLLARDFDGAICQPGAPDVASRFADYRVGLADGSLRMVDVCEAEHLSLLCGSIEYVSFWTTPVLAKRRYATRFFVAARPSGQTGVADGNETVASRWIEPREALTDEKIREMKLHLPTIAQLRWLQGFDTVDAAMQAAAAVDKSGIAEIVPEVLTEGGTTRFRLPDGTIHG